MSRGINKVFLLGNLGRDPELRSTPSGTQVANFSMATASSWVDKDGSKKERTEWHRVIAWGKLAEIVGMYLRKGSQAYIEGRLQTREWEDKQGQKRQTTEVVATELLLLGGKRTEERPAEKPVEKSMPFTPDPSLEPISDDNDLPF